MSFKKIKKVLKKKLTRKEATEIPITFFGGMFKNGEAAIITGGSSGIGKAIADAFLREGCKVIITSRNEKKIKESIQELKSKYPDGVIVGAECDNRHTSSIEACFKSIMKMSEINTVNILVNSAGVLSQSNFENMSEEEYDNILDTNLKGTYFWSQIVSNYFKKNSIKGNILNIGSSSCLRPALSPYTISKWGIRGLTQGLAKALIPYGVVVNGIAPGPTLTPMAKEVYEEKYIDNYSIPSGRYVMPEEVANLAIVLTSSMGKMIVGDILYVTGGVGVLTFEDVSYFDKEMVDMLQ